MFVLFGSDAVRRDCCDLDWMRTRWGPAIARRISHRLQQLAAMTALSDLGFLPFDSIDHGDGVFEVAIVEHLTLVIESAPVRPDRVGSMRTIVIAAVRARSTVGRVS